MSRTDSANGRVALVSRAATAAQQAEYAEEPAEERESSPPPSSTQPASTRDPAEAGPADENERARLIADITRLIREPTVPEGPRLAGLTLIGWLARRRPEETPHGIGIPEARISERRWQAARAKQR